MSLRQQSRPFGRGVLRCLSSGMMLLCLNQSVGGREILAAELPETPKLGSVALQIEASTWKPRGHVIYDIEGAIRKKLMNAGFTVLRNADAPHDHVLSVIYQEVRGAEYAFNAFGTVITCKFQFVAHPSQPMMFEFQVVETSTNSVSGTPPYLDAIHRFETNPYYFFLGDILAGYVQESLDLREALLWAVERHLAELREIEDPADRPLERSEHYMMPARKFYRPFAVRRTIQLFIEANDSAIVQLWRNLITDPDPIVRRQALTMIEAFHVIEARTELTKLAAQDVDPQARRLAKRVLASLEQAR